MRKKRSIIAIVGPTASGKSELAVKLAKKFNGEIISADSRQVYRGLDIGSGKVKGAWKKERKNAQSNFQLSLENARRTIFIYKKIPHHCIDYVSPKKRCTIVDFQQCALRAIEDIRARGKTPFLVGGTGFYIDAVLGNTMFPAVPPNPPLRKKLERFSAEKLFAMLKKKDERRAATIDKYNKRRLIRALEITMATKKPVPSLRQHALQQYIEDDSKDSRDYEKLRSQEIVVMLIGVKKDKNTLQTLIKKRVRAMLKRGLVAETKKLHTTQPAGGGLSWKRIAEFGFEYRLPALFLRKKISRKELEDRLIKENWRYAKRQLTWFRRNKNIYWISSLSEARSLLTKVTKALR